MNASHFVVAQQTHNSGAKDDLVEFVLCLHFVSIYYGDSAPFHRRYACFDAASFCTLNAPIAFSNLQFHTLLRDLWVQRLLHCVADTWQDLVRDPTVHVSCLWRLRAQYQRMHAEFRYKDLFALIIRWQTSNIEMFEVLKLCTIFLVNVVEYCLLCVCIAQGSCNVLGAKPGRAVDHECGQGDVAVM